MYVRGEGEESHKNFFWPGPKIRGGPGPPGPSPGSATAQSFQY